MQSREAILKSGERLTGRQRERIMEVTDDMRFQSISMARSFSEPDLGQSQVNLSDFPEIHLSDIGGEQGEEQNGDRRGQSSKVFLTEILNEYIAARTRFRGFYGRWPAHPLRPWGACGWPVGSGQKRTRRGWKGAGKRKTRRRKESSRGPPTNLIGIKSAKIHE
eukprot:717696_1